MKGGKAMTCENKFSSCKIDVCGSWQFAWTEKPPGDPCSADMATIAGLVFYPCTVPGNFELDLFKLDLLPDPFFRMNPVEVRKATEKYHVYYVRTFKAGLLPDAGPVLVFEGLDCFADVYVNGKHAASFDNMLIAHEVKLDTFLVPETNELFIQIRPAVAEAMRYSYPQITGSHPYGYESLYERKAPHMYGWDIMPRFIPAGLYRPVYIEYRPFERIQELYLKTTAIAEDHHSAKLILSYQLMLDQSGFEAFNSINSTRI
jgi:beta-mannosidase